MLDHYIDLFVYSSPIQKEANVLVKIDVIQFAEQFYLTQRSFFLCRETLFDAEKLNSQQEILIIFRAFWAAVGTKVIKHLIMLISKTITQMATNNHNVPCAFYLPYRQKGVHFVIIKCS